MNQVDTLTALLEAVSRRLVDAEQELTELDSQIGDGDCGAGIKAGFSAVLEGLEGYDKSSLTSVLKGVSMTIISTVGGTSGAILGTAFMKLAASLNGKDPATPQDIVAALQNALEGMKLRGEGTQVGDKTMIDALEPAILVIEQGVADGKEVVEIVVAAHAAAQKGSDSTIDMVAKKGRASYMGDRTVGHRDAGSLMIVYLFEAVKDFFAA